MTHSVLYQHIHASVLESAVVVVVVVVATMIRSSNCHCAWYYSLVLLLFQYSSSFQQQKSITSHLTSFQPPRPHGRPLELRVSPSSSSSSSSSSSLSSPYQKALIAFEKAHGEDPRTITVHGETLPYSVHYHRRMAYWFHQLVTGTEVVVEEPTIATTTTTDADADIADIADTSTSSPFEVVELAARCQHIRRWTRPRDDYPQGLKGYLQWRSDAKDFHAQQASEILLDSGYSIEVAHRVGQLLRKEKLETDPQVQLLEDVICVVFLENEYSTFIEQGEFERDDQEDKLVRIVKKTWNKMTPRGHQAALQLASQLTERGLRLVQLGIAAAEAETAKDP
jgi:hypothetical protein